MLADYVEMSQWLWTSAQGCFWGLLACAGFGFFRQHMLASGRYTLFAVNLLSAEDTRVFPCLLVADAPWDMRSYEDMYSMCMRLEWSAAFGSWQPGGQFARWRPAHMEGTNELLDVYVSADVRSDNAWAVTERVLPCLLLLSLALLLVSYFLSLVLHECEEEIIGPDPATNQKKGRKTVAPSDAAAAPAERAADAAAKASPEDGMEEIELTGCKSRHAAAAKLADGVSIVLAGSNGQ